MRALRDPDPLIRRVYSYVAYRVGDGPDAEDITTDAFERAFRDRDQFDPRRDDYGAWLIGLARNCVDEQGQAPPRRDETPGLRTAVLRLDEPERELVALRYGAELSAAQIGGLLDLDSATVGAALERALEELLRLLDREPSGG
jgi:DNA-directed RNA polymerase specialized sigma24 family protein